MKTLSKCFALAGAFWGLCASGVAQELEREKLVVDETCIISVLNRTVQASEEGFYTLPNVPSFMGQVTARASCVRDGKTISGQTDLFSVTNNEQVKIGSFYVGDIKVPTRLTLNNCRSIRMFRVDFARTIELEALYADGSGDFLDLSDEGHGVNFATSNPAVVTVSSRGLLTSHSTGEALLTARKDGVIAVTQVVVIASGDKDGDGLPDEYEL